MTNRITTEVGTTKPLAKVGRDMSAAAMSAGSHGTVTRVTSGGIEIAAVVPAGPGVAMAPGDLHEAVGALLSRLRGAFKPEATVTDADVLGLLIARFCDFEPTDILTAAAAALVDANYHGTAEEVRGLREDIGSGGTS